MESNKAIKCLTRGNWFLSGPATYSGSRIVPPIVGPLGVCCFYSLHAKNFYPSLCSLAFLDYLNDMGMNCEDIKVIHKVGQTWH